MFQRACSSGRMFGSDAISTLALFFKQTGINPNLEKKIDQRNRYINDRQKCITNSLIFVSRIFFESIIEEISLLFVAVIIDRDFGVESAFSQSHLRHLVSFLIGHNQGVEEVVTSFKEHALRAFVPALKNSKNCWITLNA